MMKILSTIKGNEKFLLSHFQVPDTKTGLAVYGFPKKSRAVDFYEFALDQYNNEANDHNALEKVKIQKKLQELKIKEEESKQAEAEALKAKKLEEKKLRAEKKLEEKLLKQKIDEEKKVSRIKFDEFVSRIINSRLAFIKIKELFTLFGKPEDSLLKLLDTIAMYNTRGNIFMGIVIGALELNYIQQIYALNEITYKRLREFVSGFGATSHENQSINPSDPQFVLRLSNNADGYVLVGNMEDFFNYEEDVSTNIYPHYTRKEYLQLKTNKKENGAFFPYFHKTSFNLIKYGIFTEEQDPNEEYKHNCLVNALIRGGISSQKLSMLISVIKVRDIPICELRTICETVNIMIRLKKIERQDHIITYGTNQDEIYNIGLIESHYFIIEEFQCTSYAIKNYNEICHIKEFFKIEKKKGEKYEKSNKRNIDSFMFIKLLSEQKDLLTPITITNSNIQSTQFYNKVGTHQSELISIDYSMLNEKNEIPGFARKMSSWKEPNKRRGKDFSIMEYEKYFCDFETYTINQVHHAYLGCYISNDGIRASVAGKTTGLDLLRSICDSADQKKIVLLIFHNAAFDFNFIMRYIKGLSIMKNGTRLLSAKGVFTHHGKDYQIEIKDSCQVIPMALKEFGKTFKLETCKEIMPYELYNIPGFVDQRFIDYSIVIKFVSEKDIEQFNFNLERWNCIQDGLVDIIEYSRRYCEIDCEVLMTGYEIFRGWMEQVTMIDDRLGDESPKFIDIDDVMTLPGLAHLHLIQKGCYEDVYELAGPIREFIQESVVGGRCMSRNNKKLLVTSNKTKIASLQSLEKENIDIFDLEGENINDNDGVSLYPSAMVRMGYLKGIPKLLTRFDYEYVSQFDGYFVDVLITKVNKKLNFPVMSYVNRETGVRQFVNEMEGRVLRLDKVMLEDAIQFQEIEFEIQRGYYFDEGFNYKIQDVIMNLFLERLAKKSEKDENGKPAPNPIEVVYKLIMNAAYGKTILKPIEDDSRVFDNSEDYQIFVNRNYNWIKEITPISDSSKTIVKTFKRIDNHYNIPHVGSSVLSMSKRIMNEVMCLAEDLNCDIYYQDTDSMHLKDSSISIIATAFEVKYGRKLIGKQLGQFHSDFNLDECKNVISKELICLGKKCYIDRLEGECNGKIENGFHTRMKGVTGSCVPYTAQKNNMKDEFELYYHMLLGNEVVFDLTEGAININHNADVVEVGKVKMKMNKNYTVSTLLDFSRKLCFL